MDRLAAVGAPLALGWLRLAISLVHTDLFCRALDLAAAHRAQLGSAAKLVDVSTKRVQASPRSIDNTALMPWFF